MSIVKKMSVKKLRELLAEVRVYNDSALTKVIVPTPPIITYRKSNRHQGARWVVTRTGHKTDPENGHFLDGHNKTFRVVSADQKQTELVRAIGWASEKYGYTIDEWVKTPFGSWAPKTALESALWHHLHDHVPRLFAEEATTSPSQVDRDITPTEADGWYRMVSSGVVIFTQATSEHDARGRIVGMVAGMTMDVPAEVYITRRDPEVN